MATAAIISPSEKKSYCFRLLSLTVDGGTLVLRHQFDRIIPPKDLQATLNTPNVRGKLNSLRKTKVITAKQYLQLYPQVGQPSSEDFDVSLLTCLLRYICNLDENSLLWDRIPSSRDTSLVDDIVRLKLIRNEVSHKQALSLSQQEFSLKWSDIEQVILRLGQGIPDLAESIQALKESSIDPVKEQEYEELIKDWESSDRALTEQLTAVKKDVAKHEGDISNLKQTVEAQQTKEHELTASISEYDEIIKGVQTTINETFGQVHEIKTKQENFEDVLRHTDKEHSELAQIVDEQVSNQLQITERLTKAEDSIITLMEGGMGYQPTELSPMLKSLASMTTLFFEDAEHQPYVITNAHVQAREKLRKSHVVVLNGQPGEGKTTMAIQLISEVTKLSSCLKLRGPSDWKHIDLTQKTFDTVFIDDIFGEGALDEKLLQRWNRYLPEIEKTINRKRLYVIITSRHYIFEEANERLRGRQLFTDENIQRLSSSDLTDEERMQMLTSHLDCAKRERNETFVEDCNKVYKSAFIKDEPLSTEHLVGGEFSQLDKKSEMNVMMGFPESVHMFANDDSMFDKGADFFEMPVEVFQKHLEGISANRSAFFELILIWAVHENKLNLANIEPPVIAKDIEETAKYFGMELKGEFVESIRQSLKHHRGGFVRFSPKTGDYTFCHSIVRDIVGIIAGKYYPNAVVFLASHDFLMKYVTTVENKRDGFHVFVEEFRYKQLEEAILKLIRQYITSDRDNANKETAVHKSTSYYGSLVDLVYDVSVDVSKLLLMPLCSDFIPSICTLELESHWNIDSISILRHDAFENRIFISMFLNSKEGKEILSEPVASFRDSYELERYYGICLDENVKIYVPAFLLLYGNDKLLLEYMENIFDPLAEKSDCFLYTSLLIATDLDMENVIKTLLSYDAKPNEDHLIIASAKNTKVLNMLLDKWDRNLRTRSHIKHKTSSLIYAAKRGFLGSVKCLLRHGVEVNYRNSNNRSALDKAVQYGKTEVCRILLENGANVNVRAGKFKRTPLHMASDIGHDQCTEIHRIVEILLQHGASMKIKDYRGHFPIHCAAIRCHNKVVQILLIEDSSQMSCRTTSYGRKSRIKGMTLLHIAVWKSNVELVEILLNMNVNPDTKDCFGRTALYCAAYEGKTKIVRLLVRVSNAQLAEKNGFTPLHAAIHKRHTEIVELLCPYSDINVPDKFGKTPLHTACEVVDLEVIKLLVLEYKADTRMLTKKCLSVFRLLKDRRLQCMVVDITSHFLGIAKNREDELEECEMFLRERDPDFPAKYC
ncbi:uncharacterized protein LOC128555500 [Mercenaria mercenaria]|uniref:uncharacterized protein LOC128555500 n=1 Tax=Mercenaria mercenaria TaxID=6596 RepID=UPI00234F948D|nr:uncharacterized protein LOC128555500 [Mercenaria mercenaria]